MKLINWLTRYQAQLSFKPTKLQQIILLFLFAGDEIFSVNGRSVAGLTHSEAIGIFKETKVGSIQVTLGRRETKHKVVGLAGDIQC